MAYIAAFTINVIVVPIFTVAVITFIVTYVVGIPVPAIAFIVIIRVIIIIVLIVVATPCNGFDILVSVVTIVVVVVVAQRTSNHCACSFAW